MFYAVVAVVVAAVVAVVAAAAAAVVVVVVVLLLSTIPVYPFLLAWLFTATHTPVSDDQSRW